MWSRSILSLAGLIPGLIPVSANAMSCFAGPPSETILQVWQDKTKEVTVYEFQVQNGPSEFYPGKLLISPNGSVSAFLINKKDQVCPLFTGKQAKRITEVLN